PSQSQLRESFFRRASVPKPVEAQEFLLRRPCLPSSPPPGEKRDGEADINSRRNGLVSSAVRFSAFLRVGNSDRRPNVRKRAPPARWSLRNGRACPRAGPCSPER